jgi:hypothetical protein
VSLSAQPRCWSEPIGSCGAGFRQACYFVSPRGAEVAIHLQVLGLNARRSKQNVVETSHSLYCDFLNLGH